jgi:hypothetical protein
MAKVQGLRAPGPTDLAFLPCAPRGNGSQTTWMVSSEELQNEQTPRPLFLPSWTGNSQQIQLSSWLWEAPEFPVFSLYCLRKPLLGRATDLWNHLVVHNQHWQKKSHWGRTLPDDNKHGVWPPDRWDPKFIPELEEDQAFLNSRERRGREREWIAYKESCEWIPGRKKPINKTRTIN